jgi:hypothetical protein
MYRKKGLLNERDSDRRKKTEGRKSEDFGQHPACLSERDFA